MIFTRLDIEQLADFGHSSKAGNVRHWNWITLTPMRLNSHGLPMTLHAKCSFPESGKPPMILALGIIMRILAKPRAQVHSEVQLQLYTSSLIFFVHVCLIPQLPCGSHAGIRIRKVLILLALWGAPQSWPMDANGPSPSA